MNQQPDNPYEQYLRNEKIKPLAKYAKDGMTILDLGGGSGECWNTWTIDTPLTLMDTDQNLAADSECYEHIIIDDAKNAKFFAPEFDIVSIMGLLEHVDDPLEILNSAAGCKQYIYVTVPNAESFHRFVGVGMGVIDSIYELGPQDLLIGHKRVFDRIQLWDVLKDVNGFEVLEMGTTSFKMFTSDDMMNLGEDMVISLNNAAHGKFSGSEKFYGAELYAVLVRTK